MTMPPPTNWPPGDQPFEHECWKPNCGNVSHTAREAFEHWREHRRAERPENQPLVAEGERIGVVLRDGKLYIGKVVDYHIDRVTGEHRIIIDDPQPEA